MRVFFFRTVFSRTIPPMGAHLGASGFPFACVLASCRDAIFVPAIFRIEVASALARAGMAAAYVDRLVGELLARATEVTIGPVRARSAQRVAIDARLRAADAVYVWIAERYGLPLVTADQEILTRAATRRPISRCTEMTAFWSSAMVASICTAASSTDEPLAKSFSRAAP